MKFDRVHDDHLNAKVAFLYLIDALSIKTSNSFSKRIEYHPEYPNLVALSDMLDEIQVEHLSARITMDDISDIPLPALIHLRKHSGHFVVLKSIQDNELFYYDPEFGRIISKTKPEFEKEFSGIVLLVQKNDNSGERDYKANRNVDLLNKYSLIASAVLIFLSIIVPLQYITWQESGIYFTKLIGLFLSALLLQKQFGESSTTVDKFCTNFRNSDCDSVIKSAAGKLFGIFNLSEIGTMYFSGGILTFIIAGLAKVDVSILFLLSILSLPFSLWAIYYQGRVLRKWCPLCLAVMAVLWMEFSIHLMAHQGLVISSFKSFEVAFIGFSIPLASWLFMRPFIVESSKIKTIERSAYRILRNNEVFQNMLAIKPQKDIGQLSMESSGFQANMEIFLVSSPTCPPCGRVHRILDDLKSRVGTEDLKITHQFLVNPEDKKALSYRMLRIYFLLAKQESLESADKTTSFWYDNVDQTILEDFEKRFGTVDSSTELEIQNQIAEQFSWCKSNEIIKTPTILINGREFPEEFSINDLCYHVLKMMKTNKVNHPDESIV